MSREDFEGIKELAKKNHRNRVAKTPMRVKYAIEQFEKNNIPYELKNAKTGHFLLRNGIGLRIQFWASTGTIGGSKNIRGIKAVIRLYKHLDVSTKSPDELAKPE